MKNTFVKTNLRWAGGKSKLMKFIERYLPDNVEKYLETFTGGGSVLLYILQKFHPSVSIANDIDTNLINYYNSVKDNPDKVINECLEVKNKYDAETFRDAFKDLNRVNASDFFIANKTSFSGLNKTYSIQAYDRNFSVKCINKINDISHVIKDTTFTNMDFYNLDEYTDIEDYFIYLDPPYYGNREKGLYGDSGKLHKDFDHERMFEWVNKHKDNNKIMISYDDSPYIRRLYKDFHIYQFDVPYSMTNVGGNSCKIGKEIVITNYEVKREMEIPFEWLI